jgi:hypothetical protein
MIIGVTGARICTALILHRNIKGLYSLLFLYNFNESTSSADTRTDSSPVYFNGVKTITVLIIISIFLPLLTYLVARIDVVKIQRSLKIIQFIQLGFERWSSMLLL